jgi:hypothetical protein
MMLLRALDVATAGSNGSSDIRARHVAKVAETTNETTILPLFDHDRFGRGSERETDDSRGRDRTAVLQTSEKKQSSDEVRLSQLHDATLTITSDDHAEES